MDIIQSSSSTTPISVEQLSASDLTKNLSITLPGSEGLSNMHPVESSSAEVDGWYYDIQKRNTLTSIKLFSNMVLADKDSDDPSERWKPTNDNEYLIPLDMCSAVMTEDFNININNTWSDVGSDWLGDAWNQMVRPLAPYANKFGKIFDKLMAKQDSMSDAEKEKLNKSVIAGGLMKAAEKTRNITEEISGMFQGGITGMMNSVMVTQGSQFTYYAGTNFNFSNLGMRFTLFPTFDDVGHFVTVSDQLEDLYPYLAGHMTSGPKLKGGAGNSAGQEIAEYINKYVKWQDPPAGYKTDFDNAVEAPTIAGTFQLRFGPYYKISNLIVADASFNFSKQMVKNPDAIINEQGLEVLSPLYCDVSIVFKPATKYSDNNLRDFVSALNSEELGEGILTRLEKLKLSANLTKIKASI